MKFNYDPKSGITMETDNPFGKDIQEKVDKLKSDQLRDKIIDKLCDAKGYFNGGAFHYGACEGWDAHARLSEAEIAELKAEKDIIVKIGVEGQREINRKLSLENQKQSALIDVLAKALEFVVNYPHVDKHFLSTSVQDHKTIAREALEQLKAFKGENK